MDKHVSNHDNYTEGPLPSAAPTLHLSTIGEQTWNEELPTKVKKSNKALRIISYIALGIFSFFLFLYLTFPYGVIKEAIVVQANEQMSRNGVPFRLSIGTLRPYWLTGFELRNITLTNRADNRTAVRFDHAVARLQIFPLLIGNLKVNAAVTQRTGGLNATSTLPLFATLQGNANPKHAHIQFHNFAIDPLFSQGFAMLRQSRDPGALLLAPMFSQASGGGALNGTVLLNNPSGGRLTAATGNMDLQIRNGFLDLANATLQIPKQNFNTAKFDVRFENGSVLFSDQTKLESEDLEVSIAGKIDLPENPGGAAMLDLNLGLGMRGQIEKNFGTFLIVLGCQQPVVDGRLNAKLVGPAGATTCQ